MVVSTPVKVAVSVVVALLLTGCDRPKAKGMEPPAPGPVPVSTMSAQSSNVPMVLEATGLTQGSNAAQIYARVSGYLQRINYTEGQKVNAGDLLFTIDPADLTNARDAAKASMMQAQAAHDNARIILDRTRHLTAARAASQQDLDLASANEKTTLAQLESTMAAYSQAKLNLSYARVVAPIGGYVDKRKVDVGTYISPATNGLLTTVYQTDPMYVNFSLSETQKIAYQNAIAAGKVLMPKGGKYQVDLQLADGTTLTRSGSVDFVSPVFDPTTGTASYRATVQNGDGKLLPGQFVKVSLKGLEWNNVLTLPQKVILTGEKGKFVYVAEANNTVSAKVVQIGSWQGENVVITEGLNGSEKIVADGLTKLRPGGAIKLIATH